MKREFYRGDNGEPLWRDVIAPLATDQRTLAEREWRKPKLAPKPQQPCDHGLFGDGHLQLDLVEMFQDPTNEG